MPYLNTIGGGSARKFGFTRRNQFYSCLTHPGVATLNITDNRCYYPANYGATMTYGQEYIVGCHSGGGVWGSEPNAGCCSCAACPYPNCVGCFSIYCTCYDPGWNPLGNVSGGCYEPYGAYFDRYYYSCPVNTGIATPNISVTSSPSSAVCVYPASYNATLIG